MRLPTNCKNCGAVLHGNKCEYCGTEYGASIEHESSCTSIDDIPAWYFSPSGRRRMIYGRDENGNLMQPIIVGQHTELCSASKESKSPKPKRRRHSFG